MDEGSRWDPRVAKGGATARSHLEAVAPPGLILLAPDLFLLGNNSRKFSAQSEKLPRTTFLKQKDNRKQELALGILLIG